MDQRPLPEDFRDFIRFLNKEVELFKEKGSVYRMGRPPIQIDIINQADGIDIRDCYPRRQVIQIDDLEVAIISREDFIKNKKASGRLQDLADIEKITSSNDS